MALPRPLSDLPPPWSEWVAGGTKGRVPFFAREANVGFAIVLTVLAAVAPLVFLIDTLGRLRAARDVAPGDVWAAVPAVALLVFAGWFVRRQVTRARAQREGRLLLGVFVGPEGLLWCDTPGRAHVFPAASIATLEVTAEHHGKTGPSPGAFLVVAREGAVTSFEGASDYPVGPILDAVRAALPRVTVKVDPALSGRYASAMRRDAPQAPPPRQAGSELFRKLLQDKGIGVRKVREASSVGASAGSLDEAELWLFSQPLRVRLRELDAIYPDLGPRDQHGLDAARRQAKDQDPIVTITRFAFCDLTDFELEGHSSP